MKLFFYICIVKQRYSVSYQLFIIVVLLFASTSNSL